MGGDDNRPIRVFVGVWPDAAALEAMQPLLAWAGALADYRPAPAGLVHMTVLFLGQTDPAQALALVGGLRERLVGLPPVRAEIAGAVALPSARRPRVIAAAVHPSREVLALFEAVREVALAVAPTRDLLAAPRREPLPHLTLARLSARRRPRLLQLAQCPAVTAPFRMERAAVVRSDPGPGGPAYSILGLAVLGGESNRPDA